MRTCPHPPIPQSQQLSLLPDPGDMPSLPPEERRKAVTLLATLLIEAGRSADQEPADDGR